MSDISFNIIELIETNPITQLTNTYQNKLLIKIKDEFTDYEQKMFISSFYGYMNYDTQNDFVIDLDEIWKWLGFNQKVKAKLLLEKHFNINKDYILLSREGKQPSHPKGGHNKETFMLNIDTFKKMCLKSGTKKADEIHNYFIKLERILQMIIKEESDEIKNQLKQKNNIEMQLKQKIISNEDEKIAIREKTLIEQFPSNTQCIYYGIIDNLSDNNEKLIKFGNSNNLRNRVTKHKDTYLNFKLINAFKVDNKLQVENAIKHNSFFQERQRTIIIKSKKYIELLSSDGVSFTELDKIIKSIISSIECTPENYIKVLEENRILKEQIIKINETNNTNNLVILNSEYNQLKCNYIRLTKLFNRLKKNNTTLNLSINDIDNIDVTQQEQDNFSIVSSNNTIKDIKEIFFDENNKKKFKKMFGTREEVWNGLAYKTSGELTIKDLTTNKDGKIVSRKKSIQEAGGCRFLKYGVNK